MQAVSIRTEPTLDKSCASGHLFLPGDDFIVSEEVRGDQGVTFLRLQDGRGWLFDRKPGVGIMCVRTSMLWMCQPCSGKDVGIRTGPSIDAPLLPDAVLHPGDVFIVSEELQGEEQVLFLRLASGRGWVFNCKPNVGTMCVRPTARHRRKWRLQQLGENVSRSRQNEVAELASTATPG